MKWRIENRDSLKRHIFIQLMKGIKDGNFSNTILNSVLEHADYDTKVILSTDNKKYNDRLINKIISLCHENNFIFEVMKDNNNPIYKNNQPKEFNEWYFMLSKLNFRSKCEAYHVHFSTWAKNYHLIVLYDNEI